MIRIWKEADRKIEMTVRIIIRGKVQGVFFRKSAKDIADNLGVVGWIRNNRDGSVESLATGEKESLDSYIQWCRKGPGLAEVENLEVEWIGTEETFDSFEVI